MCEQLTTWRKCTSCAKLKSKIIRNINCDKVSIFKFGQCVRGLTYREEEEPIECSDCETKRKAEVEADRKRRFQEAWPEAEEDACHEEKDEAKSDGSESFDTENMTVTSEESWKMV